MKVTLILPRAHLDHDLLYGSFPLIRVMRHMMRPFMPGLVRSWTGNLIVPLGLLNLAAVTPPNVRIHIIDERFQSIESADGADLCGITAVTKTVTRAYEIAAKLRARGIKVVLGGPHATLMPEEALRYVDAVAVGEGEYTWPTIIEDARSDCLKSIYCPIEPTRPDDIPPPRLDVIEKDYYAPIYMLETARGCPHSCVFCTVSTIWGRRYRKRSVESIVEELSNQRSRIVWLTSDNLTADLRYAKELLRALAPTKILWAAYSTVDAALDTEFLDLAVASGCQALFLGFETLSSESLAAIQKQSTNSISEYEAAIRNLHERGILVAGSFLFGFDHDTTHAFDETVDFIETNHIECPNINIVVPYPGTELYLKLQQEKRLLHQDWRYYDTGASYVVFQPANMSPQELRRLHLQTEERIFGYSSILRRTRHLRSPIHSIMAWQFNLGMRHINRLNLEERVDPKTQKHY